MRYLLSNVMVGWLPRWLGRLYCRLYSRFGEDIFTVKDVERLVRSDVAARVALSRMRRSACIFLHEGRGRRRFYRLAEPEAYTLAVDGVIKGLDKIPQQRYARLLGLFCAEAHKHPWIKSIVLFGSVARGDARTDSDIDLLVVVEGFNSLGQSLEKLVEIEESPKVSREIRWLEEHGIDTHLSFYPISPHTLAEHPPIILDTLIDGIVLVDDGTYLRVAREAKQNLKKLHARRIMLSDNEWVWVLKPTLRFGEVIEI